MNIPVVKSGKEAVHQANMARYIGRILIPWLMLKSTPSNIKIEDIQRNIAVFVLDDEKLSNPPL
jgi:hypothetical protein